MNQAAPAPKRHSTKSLLIPFIIVGIGLVLWSGWWFYLTHEVKTQMASRLERLEASGWSVKYDRIGASGWPMHARLTLYNPEIIAPSGQGIRAPYIAAEATSYKPTHWVIAANDGLTLIRAERGDTNITAKAIRMSLTGLRQPWPNVSMEMVQPHFAPVEGAQPFPLADAALVQLYMRPHIQAAGSPNGEDNVDVLFRLIDAHGREGGPIQGLTQSGKLTLQVEAVIEQASALRKPATDQGLLAAWTASGGYFAKVRGEMQAGVSHALLTSPELRAADNGQLEGTVTFKTQKPLAAIVGLAGSNVGLPAERAADAQAATSTPQGGQGAEGQDIELTVSFRKGRTYLGPFPLAPAPRLF